MEFLGQCILPFKRNLKEIESQEKKKNSIFVGPPLIMSLSLAILITNFVIGGYASFQAHFVLNSSVPLLGISMPVWLVLPLLMVISYLFIWWIPTKISLKIRKKVNPTSDIPNQSILFSNITSSYTTCFTLVSCIGLIIIILYPQFLRYIRDLLDYIYLGIVILVLLYYVSIFLRIIYYNTETKIKNMDINEKNIENKDNNAPKLNINIVLQSFIYFLVILTIVLLPFLLLLV